MIVALDTSALCLLLHPDADVPIDPGTGRPIDRAAERMCHLVDHLALQGARILIPTPVLSEFLTFASTEYLDEITRSRHFLVAAFDQRAAVEAAIALQRAIASGAGKRGGLSSTWQKIKVDRQIVAIAKVYEADTIYTTDSDVLSLAQESGLRAIYVGDLPLPPSKTPLLDTAGEVRSDDGQ